jgi:hypothetical protein
MPTFDAVLVPGGGVREGGVLPPWVRARLDLALRLCEGSRIIALSAGTTYRPPPLDPNGFPIFESVAGARYLIAAGVPPEQILTETHSYDTIGNAFFSRVLHVDVLGLRRLLVITSEFHMPRTEAVFRWVYGLTPKALEYELTFRAAPDEISADGRAAKERASLEKLLPLTRRITTMESFHQWLFSEHQAYQPQAAGFGRNTLSGDALEFY